MAERIKKHWDLALVFGVGLVLVITAVFAVFPNPVSGDVATTIVVTATVQEYLTFTSSHTAVSITPDLIDTAGVTHLGSSTIVTLTLNTSSENGYSITVSGADAGLSYGATGTIGMTTNTTTVAAGTDAFGLQAVSTYMTIQPLYSFATTTANVGRASSSASVLASKATAGSGQLAWVKFLAACDPNQLAGSYTDTITLTAIPSP